MRAVPNMVVIVCAIALSGCAALDNPTSPDVAYSKRSGEARTLRVPPDLTDVSDAEQFVLPGADGAAMTRNTLLPGVKGVRLERGEGQAWLAFDTAPEALWPQLIGFVVSRGYTVDRTLPVAGTIQTRWRPLKDGEVDGGGVLGGLIGGSRDARSRIAWRLERASDGGARLFARRQIAAGKTVDAGEAPDWPPQSADPESTDSLLAEFLAFIGLKAQQAAGIVDASTAADVLDDAVVRTSVAGSQLVVHRGYRSAFEAIGDALEQDGQSVRSRDDSVGRIVFVPKADEVAASGTAPPVLAPLVLVIEPVHVGAVRIGLVDESGRRIEAARERAVLDGLAARLV